MLSFVDKKRRREHTEVIGTTTRAGIADHRVSGLARPDVGNLNVLYRFQCQYLLCQWRNM